MAGARLTNTAVVGYRFWNVSAAGTLLSPATGDEWDGPTFEAERFTPRVHQIDGVHAFVHEHQCDWPLEHNRSAFARVAGRVELSGRIKTHKVHAAERAHILSLDRIVGPLRSDASADALERQLESLRDRYVHCGRGVGV